MNVLHNCIQSVEQDWPCTCSNSSNAFLPTSFRLLVPSCPLYLGIVEGQLEETVETVGICQLVQSQSWSADNPFRAVILSACRPFSLPLYSISFIQRFSFSFYLYHILFYLSLSLSRSCMSFRPFLSLHILSMYSVSVAGDGSPLRSKLSLLWLWQLGKTWREHCWDAKRCHASFSCSFTDAQVLLATWLNLKTYLKTFKHPKTAAQKITPWGDACARRSVHH